MGNLARFRRVFKHGLKCRSKRGLKCGLAWLFRERIYTQNVKSRLLIKNRGDYVNFCGFMSFSRIERGRDYVNFDGFMSFSRNGHGQDYVNFDEFMLFHVMDAGGIT